VQPLSVLEQLPAASLEEVARALVGDPRSGGAAPDVSLLLTSGAAVRGRLLALDQGVLMVLGRPGGGGPGGDLIYLQLSHVAALRVHAPEAAAHLLTFGAAALPVPPPPDAPDPPTRLELQRRVASLSSRSAALGLRIELAQPLLDTVLREQAEARRVAGLVAEDLVAALEALSADADGREALEPLSVVRLAAGPLGAQVDGSTLALSFQAELGLGGRPTPAALQDALESTL
jgi:hypothetical protein